MDEDHAGAILATIHALQNKRDELRKEVVELKQHQTSRHKQLREARQETKDQKARAATAKGDLQRVLDALHQTEEEWDEAQVSHQKALTKSTQTLAEQGVQQLLQELATTKKSWNISAPKEVSRLQQ